MEGWPLSKCKSSIWWLLMMVVVAIFVVQQTQGRCIEEERITLLEIKASFNLWVSDADYVLPTWVDHGSGECCDWERVQCNTTTSHVTQLSLDNLKRMDLKFWYPLQYISMKKWPLNVSLFLHFEELRSLNLSMNFLDNTGLERFPHLKKLEILDLSRNLDIGNEILPSLSALTSLRILDLSETDLKGNFPANDFVALENLEMLDLTSCSLYGNFEIQGSMSNASILKKLKTLNLGFNSFNESSIITSLSALPSLEALDLSENELVGAFPAQELSGLRALETLDMSGCGLDSLAFNQPPNLPNLKVLLLRANNFNGTLPMEAFRQQ